MMPADLGARGRAGGHTLYTIGFTRRPAAEFFGVLRSAGIRLVVDVRLNNTSQLAGFAKRPDLEFFLWELCGAQYVHELALAPTPELLAAYRRSRSWDDYARAFLDLLGERRVELHIDRALLARPVALLCTEPAPVRCHRRLVAEYLQAAWGGLEIVHL
jgi:uncharacterized protein (DUF488 family)